MQLTYNNITLYVTKTNSVTRNPVKSHDQVDYLYDHVVIDVEFLYSPQATAYGEAKLYTLGTDPVDTDVAIRHYLMEPRKPLRLDEQSTPLYSSEGIDANNGPFPVSLTIRRVDGSHTWMGRYVLETWVSECPPGTQVPSPLISNRYSCSHTINAQRMTTEVKSGTAVFLTDILEETDKVADDFRNMILPPIGLGMQRVRVDVAVHPAANAISWATHDVEQFFDKGDTGKNGSRTHITDIVFDYGTTSVQGEKGFDTGATLAQVDITIIGTKEASHWRMTQEAFKLAATKVPLADANKGILRQIAIRQSMTDRRIHLLAVVELAAVGDAEISPLARDGLRTDAVFADLGGRNPTLQNDAGTRGSYKVKALVDALHEVCVPYPGNSTFILQQFIGFGVPVYSGPQPEVNIEVEDVIPQKQTFYKADPPVHSSYHLEIEHKTNEGVLALPVAGLGGHGGGSTPAPPDTEFVRAFRPQSERMVRFTAESWKNRPRIPNPVPTDPNLVLLDWRVIPHAPAGLPDGETHAYRISGWIKYGMVRAIRPGDRIPMGAMPWLTTGFAANFIEPDDFIDGLGDGDSGHALPGGPVGPNV